MSVTLRDFQPINRWSLDIKGPKWNCCEEHMGQPIAIIDETTGRLYGNESRKVVATKCFLLTLGTPFVHSIASLINIAYRIVKLVTLSHFWMLTSDTQCYHFKFRATEAAKDLLRLVLTPIALVGLELAALYGIFRQYDGRKLYASIERGLYGNFILAPCFQPNPTIHAFGGDINKKDVF